MGIHVEFRRRHELIHQLKLLEHAAKNHSKGEYR